MQKNRAAMTGHHRIIIIAKLNNIIIRRIIAPHLFMAKIKRTGDMAVICRTVRIVTPATICGDLITGHFGRRTAHPVLPVIYRAHRPAPTRRRPVTFALISRPNKAAETDNGWQQHRPGTQRIPPAMICGNNPIIDCHFYPLHRIQPSGRDLSNICSYHCYSRLA